ncbi:unnamed protein product [Rhizoctonia solani]|uniref:Dynamin-type G domain-containing protein n=1 Tax=Rhizoctonia solani TaxID=456999 RepID=A0A8H3CAC2_9AGAM|nr:unnamed protein product [Rhizoctonia solani]
MNNSAQHKPVDAASELLGGQESQTVYVTQRDRLIIAVSQTTEIVTELRVFIHNELIPKYPSTTNSSEIPKGEPQPESFDHYKFHILGLGLSGADGSPVVASHFGKRDIINLLNHRIEEALAHIERLNIRIADARTKVLVAGNLNSGKSTLINALLHRDILPTDLQPMTSVLCEIHNATENDGAEEIHVIKLDQVLSYDRTDPITYTKAAISDLEELQGDPDDPPDRVLKVYVLDSRSRDRSLLNNGIADITLIDSPGLNLDALRSSMVLACQEEADVIVFCIDAGNYLTQSAIDFLRNAGREKAHIFVVVNRYDVLEDKARCKRRVLKQIQELSPHTYAGHEELVHFVDSKSALAQSLVDGADEQGLIDPAFVSLETSLRSFVLHNRSKSKLMPAQNYLMKLLSDVDLLTSSSALLSESEIDGAKPILEKSKSILEGLKAQWEAMGGELEDFEQKIVRAVEVDVIQTNENNLKVATEDTVNQAPNGELGAFEQKAARTAEVDVIQTNENNLKVATEDTPNGELDAGSELSTWRSVLGVWGYVREAGAALLQTVQENKGATEDQARYGSVVDRVQSTIT